MKKLRKFSCSFTDDKAGVCGSFELWAYDKAEAKTKIASLKSSSETYVESEYLSVSRRVFLAWDAVWQVFHGIKRGVTERPFRLKEIPLRVWWKIEDAICMIPRFKRSRESRCHRIADQLFARTPVIDGVIISHRC